MVIAAVHTNVVQTEEQFEQLLATVSNDRRERVLSLKQPNDRKRSLCAGLALELCLRTKGIYSAEVERDVHGKPQLCGDMPWQFSLSHSGEWGVCALARTAVGIDIERYHPRHVAALAARYFTEDEQTALAALSEGERERAFFRLWTAKESILKAQGVGLSGGLRTASVEYGAVLSSPLWQLKEYELPQYAVTVCGTEPFPEELLIFSSYDSVLLR